MSGSGQHCFGIKYDCRPLPWNGVAVHNACHSLTKSSFGECSLYTCTPSLSRNIKIYETTGSALICLLIRRCWQCGETDRYIICDIYNVITIVVASWHVIVLHVWRCYVNKLQHWCREPRLILGVFLTRENVPICLQTGWWSMRHARARLWNSWENV